jgi:hypothetical protein
MTIVTLDAVDAVDLAEILEFFMQRIDVLAEHDLAGFFFSECSPYGIDDLRADVVRLIHRLYTSPYAPARFAPGDGPTPSADVVVVEVDRGSASTRGRSPGMTWFIRLRRDDHSVIVAIGLSRGAAEYLADRIAGVLGLSAHREEESGRP